MVGQVTEMTFKEKLEFGKVAEKEIEGYLRKQGYYILRSYDYGEENKSPRLENQT